MKNIKSYFRFNRDHRSGIFLLFLLIIFFQMLWYFYTNANASSKKVTTDEKKWLALQSQIDSMKLINTQKKYEIKPFNPNFISDYKGYILGMSVKEINRLHQFRAKEKFVNSTKEFQVVTQISDSLLSKISPYFKFPDWVKNKKLYSPYAKFDVAKKEKIIIKDINEATQEDLVKIYGIGEALSVRILKEKEKFGGFVSMDQMNDIWGLSPEVIENLNKYFAIKSVPPIKKISINTASIKELAQFPYFRYTIAKSIVTYRSMNGDIKTFEDLTKIKGFPVEKVNIIGLYLDFN